MAVIRTKQNIVCAYEPASDDLFVKVVWHGPHEDGRHAVAFETPPEAIEGYEAAVSWAVSMADAMAYPLHVVPMRSEQVFTPEYVARHVATMTDQDRGELRHLVVTSLAEVLRDCDDAHVRAEAFDVLVNLRVVRS